MDIMEWSWKRQNRAEEYLKRFGKGKYGRVLKMAKKPDGEEYKRTLQITSIGVVLIGGVGFLIYLTWKYGPGLLRTMLGM
jgi:protein transport protein SEC61 subunit gamma-like protein